MTMKELGQIKNMIKRFGGDATKIMIFSIKNWNWLKRDFRIDGELNIAILSGFSTTIQGKMAIIEKSAIPEKKESASELHDSKTVGW